MPIPYNKRIKNNVAKTIYIPRDIDTQFKKINSNFQGWVKDKIKEEIENAGL